MGPKYNENKIRVSSAYTRMAKALKENIKMGGEKNEDIIQFFLCLKIV